MSDTRRDGLGVFVKRLLTRSALGPDEQQALLGMDAQVGRAKQNEELVRLGEVVDRTCLVVDGLLARFGQTRDGLRQISALYIPGDMPDLHSFVMPHSTSAMVALCPSVVLRVPHAEIARVTTRYPAIAAAFWRDCTMDTMMTVEWLLNVSRRNAESRLAHLLCEMATRHEQIGSFAGLRFPFAITQLHLGDAVGMTSVHVNRTLRKLKAQGAATMSRGWVEVLDWPKLTAIAGYDPGYLHLSVRY